MLIHNHLNNDLRNYEKHYYKSNCHLHFIYLD